MLRRTFTRQRGTLARYALVASSVGWLPVLHASGCASGTLTDEGMTDVPGSDAEPGDGATLPGSDASGDATNHDSSADGSESAGGDGSDTTNRDSGGTVNDDAGEDATQDATSDAAADASSPLDASTDDATADATSDAGLDAAPLRDAAPPPDASCTTTTACGVQALCITGSCTASRRVFVSNERFTGNLGGTSGADNSCQSIANGAQLGGSWKAWVSDGTTSPSMRFTQAPVGYRLLDGTLLAANWTSLVGGALLHGIDVTEQHATVGDSQVWTGTLSTGVAIGTNVCNGFTSSANGAAQAVVGDTTRTDIGWSNATSQACDSNTLRIYCVEQ